MAQQPERNALSARPATRRLGGRKDRTGCITCKIRRVKCDEEKPACRRCTSTGRKCDGYAHIVSRTQDTLLCVRPRQLMGSGVPTTNSDEHAAFQFFAHAGASSLAGFTDIAFWTRLVPQYAQADAAVYHASVAVGALLMRIAGVPGVPGNQNGQYTRQLTLLAVERQNRAIQSTLHDLVARSTTTRQPAGHAVRLLLLFCIEALQGREVEALQLFQRGIQALSSTGDPAATAGLDAQLDRLRVQCGMFNASGANAAVRGRMRAMAHVHTHRVIPSLDVARDELSDIIAAVQHTVADSWDRPQDVQPEERQTLRFGLNGWRIRFELFVSDMRGWPNNVPHPDAATVYLLRMRERIAQVWLADSPDGSEMVYDSEEYVAVFADIAVEAGRCLQSMRKGTRANNEEQTLPSFTFEMGLVPPLYWAILKCRRPGLRQQLLALLRQAPLQEGLWNRQIMVQVAEQVIAFEEAERGEDISIVSRSEHESGFVASRGERGERSRDMLDAPETLSCFVTGKGADTVWTGSQKNALTDGHIDGNAQIYHAPGHSIHSPVHLYPDLYPEMRSSTGLPPESRRIKIVQIGLRTTLADGMPGDRVQCFGRPHNVAGALEGALDVVLEFVATAA
ncbi:hypothetical protein SEUCBS140593_008812 [Sporothrix eucalyptigena]|uniref:Zn(2)-C6 fungal-type domain-containing protein n=1 Tax=Sporothrix eucalyptigena TaxID=1812306 RepID=A0ABP0CPL4_9PEZI